MMDSQRWKQIDEIFHAALEREPEERGAYLDEACAGDQDLRKEIASLLSAQEKAERSDFLSPAVEKMDKG